MNKLYKYLIFCAFSIFHLSVQAQELRRNPNLQSRVTQAKLIEIKNRLTLDDTKMKELEPIYKRYEAEINKINFTRQSALTRTSLDSLSTEEADKLVMSQLNNAVQISTIRRKYHDEFRTVLTPQQVVKVYRSEAQLNRKVLQELRRRQRE